MNSNIITTIASLSPLQLLLLFLFIPIVYFFVKKKPWKNTQSIMGLYTTDFTALATAGKLDPVVGRKEEIMRLAQVLSRKSKNNAILLGPAGVGKTAVVEGLAERIVKNDVPKELQGKRVLALDVSSLLSGTKYRGEFEERAKKIVTEISRANRSIILFIDEVHTIIQTQGTEGAVNLADMLKPALARGDLQMIGATTTHEYEMYIQPNPSFERRFQPIEIHEPTDKESWEILQGVKDTYREYHQVEFTDSALMAAIVSTRKKIRSRKLPDKAIDAIDEAASMVKVGDVHQSVHEVLLEAAMQKNPEVASRWKKIQELDETIRTSKKRAGQAILRKERETLEAELRAFGILTVDSDDVERVVAGWGNL